MFLSFSLKDMWHIDTVLTDKPFFTLCHFKYTSAASNLSRGKEHKASFCTYSLPATRAQKSVYRFGDELISSLLCLIQPKPEFIKQQLFYEISSNINCWSQNFKENQIFIAQFMFLFFFPHTFTTTLSNPVPMSALQTELCPLPAAAASLTTSLLVLLLLLLFIFFLYFFLFFFQCSRPFIVFPSVSHLHFPTLLYHSSLLSSATRTIIKMVWEMNYVYKNI